MFYSPLQRAIVVLALVFAGAVHAGSYALDTAKTRVRIGVTVASGHRFDGTVSATQGDVRLDAPAKTGGIRVALDLASVDLGNAIATAFAKSSDFLDASTYRSMEFTSTEFVFRGERPAEVGGLLTLRGQRKPVRLAIAGFRCANARESHTEICEAQIEGMLTGGELGFSGPLAEAVHAISLSIHATAVRVH